MFASGAFAPVVLNCVWLVVCLRGWCECEMVEWWWCGGGCWLCGVWLSCVRIVVGLWFVGWMVVRVRLLDVVVVVVVCVFGGWLGVTLCGGSVVG